MKGRSMAVLGAAGLAVASLPTGAVARGSRPPITKTYQVSNPVPWPVILVPVAGHGLGSGCWAGEEGRSKQSTDFKLPATGTFAVSLYDFTGDWDLALTDVRGRTLASSIKDNLGTSDLRETATLRNGKAGQTIRIVACNRAGGPSGTVRYVFTFR